MRDAHDAGHLPRRVAPDDPAAFDRLFEAYCDPLLRFIHRYVRSWEEAEDVLQELFARLWERRNELAALNDVRAYLYTAARNRAMMHLKHRAVEARWRLQQSAVAGMGEPAASVFDPLERMSSREMVAQVQEAVDDLPPRQRDVVLRRCRGESYKEIAAALGISVNTVSIHLSRAFEHLRRVLPRREVR